MVHIGHVHFLIQELAEVLDRRLEHQVLGDVLGESFLVVGLCLEVLERRLFLDLKNETVEGSADRVDLFGIGLELVELQELLLVGLGFHELVELGELDELTHTLRDVLLDIADFLEELFAEVEGLLRLLRSEIIDDLQHFFSIDFLVNIRLHLLLEVQNFSLVCFPDIQISNPLLGKINLAGHCLDMALDVLNGLTLELLQLLVARDKLFVELGGEALQLVLQRVAILIALVLQVSHIDLELLNITVQLLGKTNLVLLRFTQSLMDFMLDV